MKNLFLCILYISSNNFLLFLKTHETFLRLLSAFDVSLTVHHTIDLFQ
jgi:hypothetical protein